MESREGGKRWRRKLRNNPYLAADIFSHITLLLCCITICISYTEGGDLGIAAMV
ncbi:hypothetical protein OG21DRAFT_1506472 [Imleria badia]|nr:hypothetical protein OG21DRAFT_1506472 [Imleria badia]